MTGSAAGHGYRPIGDYAIIGDSRSAALVSRDGSIDWLCWPRFDSPSIFAALLDRTSGGRFRIRPTSRFEVERRYIPDTNVLETTFRSEGGACVVRDLMTIASEEDQRRHYMPQHELLREIEGIEGEIEIEVVFEPRPNYADNSAILEQRGLLGIWCHSDSAALILRSDLPLGISQDGTTAGGVHTIRAADLCHLTLAWDADGPAVIPLLGEQAQERIERSVRWWRDWAARSTYEGPYRDAVVRSALVLKLLAYAPSGAIIAAPTTSLPEIIGGDANWDYRFCWLRDAAMTARALYLLGYGEEASAFVHWILHATRLTWPELDVLYDVFGRNTAAERTLDHLSGYANSEPVRIGNAASTQLQLDIYGEVADAALQYVEHGGQLDRDAIRLLKGIGETILKHWRDPDEGIWEPRDGRGHHVHSKMLCWVGLDRLIQLHERHGLEIPADIYRAERRSIRTEIDERGYSPRIQSYTSTYGSEDVDASLLTMPLYNFIEGTHSRMHGTLVRVFRELGRGALVYRHLGEGGAAPDEGTFGICAFWMTEAQAKAGDISGAVTRFERILSYANDVGLFAEQIDPQSGAALGNFPQGFTHIGLINAALTLRTLQEPAHTTIDKRHLLEEDDE